MAKLKTIIKGAIYFSESENAILVPRYSGQFHAVDCDRYLEKEDILSNYEQSYFNENKDDYKEYNGVKYYYAEYSPYSTADMELLSDISGITYTDEECSF